MIRGRFVIIFFIMLLVIGCASNPPHQVYHYGGSTTDFRKGITEYHQVEYSYLTLVKGRSVIMNQPFPLDEQVTLSPNVKSITIGLHLKNFSGEKYEIWEEYALLYQEIPFPYLIKRKIEEGNLKERVIKINLPFEADAFYDFNLRICDGKGRTLFKIGQIKYATGKRTK